MKNLSKPVRKATGATTSVTSLMEISRRAMVANRRVVVITAQIQSLESCRTKNAQCEGGVNTCGLELSRGRRGHRGHDS